MSGSKDQRRLYDWFANAGLSCLVAGGISVSGCTTTATADLNAGSKKSQQVAKTSRSSTSKPTAQKIAANEPAGKARVSDLDDASGARIVAKRTPSNSNVPNRPASNAGRQDTRVASATIDPQAASAGRASVSKADANTVALQQRKAAATRAYATRGPNQVAGGVLRDNGSIKQTAGNGQSGLIAKGTTQAARADVREAARPTIQPVKSEKQVAAAVTTAAASNTTAWNSTASNHERRRADRLMERAHERYRNGYPEEALRLASVAFELEKSHSATYRRGEERPSDYITWLQSVSPARNGNPPVIRPQVRSNPQPNVSADRSSIVTTANSSDYRRVGDVFRANGASNIPLTADAAVETAAVNRSSVAVDLSVSNAPQFTPVDQPSSRSGANPLQIEVPIPPQPRSAEANLAMTSAGGPSLEGPTVSEASYPVLRSERPLEIPAPAEMPKVAARSKSAETSSSDVVATDGSEAEAEVFAESGSTSLIPAPTTQLTIASLVGLVTGVAGMFGLSWWRRQEQRHYATK